MQLLRAGQAAAAEQAFGRDIERSPKDPDHWLGRGLARSRLQRWEAAMQDLEQAVALAPAYAEAWSALADVYRWNERWSAAADAYARLAVLRPQDAQVQVWRARSLWQLQDADGARLAARRALELGADAADVPLLNAKTPQERAQESTGTLTGREYDWALSVGAAHTTSGSASADDNSVSLRRYTDWGSIALERMSLRRFDLVDQAWAVDAYPRLWSGAYANVRYQASDRVELYPHRSWRLELFQNIGAGWELAASHDELGFGSGVRIQGVAVGKYWGNFFARWRHQTVRSDSSSSRGDRLLLRYYYTGDADHYVEGNFSQGRSDDFSSALLQSARSDSRGVVWYHFLNRHWGFKLGLSQSHDSSAYNARARDVSASLTRRW
ncbi:MAG: YaiO family outer membrane beta-barrel protein [Betaproteobacteria bacterium]